MARLSGALLLLLGFFFHGALLYQMEAKNWKQKLSSNLFLTE